MDLVDRAVGRRLEIERGLVALEDGEFLPALHGVAGRDRELDKVELVLVRADGGDRDDRAVWRHWAGGFDQNQSVQPRMDTNRHE
ncbi:hypothetical protein D3C83_135580 [compost metagenome]